MVYLICAVKCSIILAIYDNALHLNGTVLGAAAAAKHISIDLYFLVSASSKIVRFIDPPYTQFN